MKIQKSTLGGKSEGVKGEQKWDVRLLKNLLIYLSGDGPCAFSDTRIHATRHNDINDVVGTL